MELNIKDLSGKYLVRRLSVEEAADIYKLCIGNPTYYRYIKSEPTMENISEVFIELPPGITAEDKYFVGFYEEERLIAIMDLITRYPDKETALIGWFMMEKEFQGKGLASGIISEVLASLREYGFRKVRLGYIKGNEESRSFWTRNGFTATGEESETEHYTIVIMESRLAAL